MIWRQPKLAANCLAASSSPGGTDADEAVSAMAPSPKVRCAAVNRNVDRSPAENATSVSYDWRRISVSVEFASIVVAEKIGAQYAALSANRYDNMAFAEFARF